MRSTLAGIRKRGGCAAPSPMIKMNVSGLPFQYYLKRFPRDCLTRSLRIDQSRSSQISRFRRYDAVVPPPFFRGVLKATPCERVARSL